MKEEKRKKKPINLYQHNVIFFSKYMIKVFGAKFLSLFLSDYFQYLTFPKDVDIHAAILYLVLADIERDFRKYVPCFTKISSIYLRVYGFQLVLCHKQ